MLTEHFFVAKVARPRPLTNVGFGFLPAPDDAFREEDAGSPPMWIESITIYPHSLTGELPFVSHRNLEVLTDDDLVCKDGQASSQCARLYRKEFHR
ncbi:kgd2 [Symbiodinium natans]|uniref:Kgd2 protein n=1 Tax=Symbiodinium natans TaxID=878477 RepID=A0A812JB57_9DINO|nr:kgd2 [Symbiodinium natans]